jgi:hypothetical protein
MPLDLPLRRARLTEHLDALYDIGIADENRPAAAGVFF